ncbi:hypothetical protein BKA93DRAFT_829654 [Sparassis latifolia]
MPPLSNDGHCEDVWYAVVKTVPASSCPNHVSISQKQLKNAVRTSKKGQCEAKVTAPNVAGSSTSRTMVSAIEAVPEFTFPSPAAGPTSNLPMPSTFTAPVAQMVMTNTPRSFMLTAPSLYGDTCLFPSLQLSTTSNMPISHAPAEPTGHSPLNVIVPSLSEQPTIPGLCVAGSNNAASSALQGSELENLGELVRTP